MRREKQGRQEVNKRRARERARETGEKVNEKRQR